MDKGDEIGKVEGREKKEVKKKKKDGGVNIYIYIYIYIYIEREREREKGRMIETERESCLLDIKRESLKEQRVIH